MKNRNNKPNMKQSTIILSLLMLACGNLVMNNKTVESEFSFYSDYYVFISDDESTPVVIPIDLNWNQAKDGYEVEFKAWHGTEDNWPINYTKKTIQSLKVGIPEESFELENTGGFSFDSINRAITVQIPNGQKMTAYIPKNDEWVLAPSDGKTFRQTYASKSSIKIDSDTMNGWLIYERVRLSKKDIVDFGDFETFFWIPLIIDQELYHFEQHKGEQFAMKWFDNGSSIVSEEVKDFSINITKTIRDKASNRDKIPKEIQITSQSNHLNITLSSEGEQVGYGAQFPKGLAYYRQSLLQSTANSNHSGYGMMELIIENNH